MGRIKRKFYVLGGIASFAVAVWAVWWYGFHGQHPQYILWPPPEPAGPPAALEKIVSIDVTDEPLREVLADLAKQHDFAIDVDEAALTNAAITGKLPVSLAAEESSLRGVLDVLARLADSSLAVVDRNGRLLVTTRSHWENTLGNYTSRIYRLEPLLAASGAFNERTLAKTIQRTVSPDTWWEVGGNGQIEAMPGALRVLQLPDVHRQIEALLAGLAELHSHPDRFEPLHVAPRATIQARKRILGILDETATCNAIETPLVDVMAYLATEHGIAISIDDRELKAFGLARNTPVTRQVSNVSLRSLLRHVLRDFDLTYIIHGGGLLITTSAAAEEHFVLQLYPVVDLVDSDIHSTESFDELIDLVETIVALDTWAPWGGPGAVDFAAGTLAVRQTNEVHEQIERLLAELRHVRQPLLYPPPATRRYDIAHDRIEAALTETTSFDFQDTPLRKITEFIQQRHNIPVLLDTRSLEDVEFDSETLANCKIDRVPLELALKWMLAEFDLAFMIRDESLVITTEENAHEFNLDTTCYYEPRLSEFGEESLEESLQIIAEIVGPDSWNNVGGPGAISAFGGALAVRQTRDNQKRIRALIRALRKHPEDPGNTEAILVDWGPDDSEAHCLSALEQTVDAEFVEADLRGVADWLSEQVHVHVRLSAAAASRLKGRAMVPVTGRFGKKRLRSVLNLLLLNRQMTWAVYNGTIWITTAEDAEENGQFMRIYPVVDLLPPENSSSFDPLSATILHTIRMGGWDDSGGTSNFDLFRDVLIVRSDAETHRLLEDLLVKLRATREKGENLAVMEVGVSPGSTEAKIIAKLASSAVVQISGVSLERALREVAERHGLPLWLDLGSLSPAELAEPIEFALAGASLGHSLELLLDRFKLAYFVRDEVLLIASKELVPSEQEHLTRVYSVDDIVAQFEPLVARPQLFAGILWPPTSYPYLSLAHRFFAGSGAMYGSTEFPSTPFAAADAESLVDHIVTTLHNWPALGMCCDSLCINGSPHIQREVEAFLAAMRHAADVTHDRSLANAKLSLHCRDVPLSEAVARLSIENNVPVFLDSETVRDALYDLQIGGPDEARVTCRFTDESLGDALNAISPDGLKLAFYEDGGVAHVTTRDFVQDLFQIQTFDLRAILSAHPDLSPLQIAAMVKSATPPLTRDNRLFRQPAGDFGTGLLGLSDRTLVLSDKLIVRCDSHQRAAIERVLSAIMPQAGEYPRPSDLARDDNQQALAALTARIAQTTDSAELIWLYSLVIHCVDYPTPELQRALVEQIIETDSTPKTRSQISLVLAARHCGRLPEQTIGQLETFAATTDDWRRMLFVESLAEIGPGAAPALARLLDFYRNEEWHFILSTLAQLGPAAKAAVPVLLEHAFNDQVSETLAAIDTDGSFSRRIIDEYLKKRDLTVEQRLRYRQVKQQLHTQFDAPEE